MPPSFITAGYELNVYATPAILTLILLVLETIFLIVALPETRGKKLADSKVTTNGKTNGSENSQANGNGAAHRSAKPASVQERLQILKTLRTLHFMFLGVFSGVEFTLTFLTFDCEHSLTYVYMPLEPFPLTSTVLIN